MNADALHELWSGAGMGLTTSVKRTQIRPTLPVFTSKIKATAWRTTSTWTRLFYFIFFRQNHLTSRAVPVCVSANLTQPCQLLSRHWWSEGVFGGITITHPATVGKKTPPLLLLLPPPQTHTAHWLTEGNRSAASRLWGVNGHNIS